MNTFHVIGIGCSPRKGGNSDILLQQALDITTQKGALTSFVRIADRRISPCDGCWRCASSGLCHIDDDMQAIYPELLQAKGIIIAGPVHMGHSVSGHAQIFLDRTFAYWHHKKLENKVGAGIVVSNRRGGISAVRTINDVFLDHHITIAGYATGYGRDPGEIRADKRAFKETELLAKRLCELIAMVTK